MLGVNANWSFLDFGTTSGKVAESDNTAQQMRRQLEQLKKAIANDLDSLHLSLQATYDKIDAIGEEVQANADAYELMNSRYVLGEVTNLELIDAHTQFLTAKKKLVEAKIEYAGLALKWMKANGALLSYIKKETGL
jgi:outer membrane protein TolC